MKRVSHAFSGRGKTPTPKNKMMRPFTLLVKPVSADCNLRCEYCFYLEKKQLYPDTACHRMSDEVLEQMIKSYMATEQPMYTFGWQGGEPTLMGAEFFAKVVKYQKIYGRHGARVGNGLQTNGTLLTEELTSLFGQHKFLAGCSLDGPAVLHDRYRLTAGGKSTHADVLHGIKLLEQHHVEYNILSLVSQSNVGHARTVYRYLKERGVQYHQYIPCVEFNEQGELLPFSINGEQWGDFLCELFDEWYQADRITVSIRYFDSILTKIISNVDNICSLGQNCCQYLVVEYNGDVYPCDFFVEPSLKLGNIMEQSWEEMLNSSIYLEFGAQKRQWHKQCDTCDCLDLCAGDCLKHRMYAGNPPQHLSYLCSGWKRFISYSRNRFEKLAKNIREQRVEEPLLSRPVPISAKPSVRRNAPCLCGSGEKFKKCCGKY